MTLYNPHSPFYALLFSALLSSCSQVESEDIKSTGIRAEIEATAEGDGNTQIEVEFFTSNNVDKASIELTSQDTLTATDGNETYSFVKKTDLTNHIYYETTILTDIANTNLTVSLQRANDISAPQSSVTLPAGMTLNMPSTNNTFYKGDIIQTTWTPANSAGSIVIDYDVDCVLVMGSNNTLDKTYNNVPDTGTHSIGVNLLLAGANIDTSNICAVTITLTRSNSGILDSNYGKGGYITASQIRSVDFSINPE